MAIKYKILSRKILKGDKKGQIRYFGMAVSGAKIPFEDVCKEIADRSTATAGDAEAVLDALLTTICSELKAGHIVELGRLCRLRLSAGSHGVEKEEQLTAHQIKQPKVIFTPGKELRSILGELSFTKAREVTVDRECTKEHIV